MGDQWEEARAQKDYATADAIRASLRDRGIAPQKERPGPPKALPGATARPGPYTASAQAFGPEVEAELNQWEEARAQKDYATADAIRASLRDRGIDPQKERPSGGA